MHQLLPLVKSLQETPYQCTYWTISFLPHQSDRQVELVIVPLLFTLPDPPDIQRFCNKRFPHFWHFPIFSGMFDTSKKIFGWSLEASTTLFQQKQMFQHVYISGCLDYYKEMLRQLDVNHQTAVTSCWT